MDALNDAGADGVRRHYTVEHMADAAEAAYKKAIEIKPDYAEAYNGLANVYNATRKFDLAAAASGSLDVGELALGLKAAGISDNHGLAADLMTELKEHALQGALQNRERDELLTSGRPHYELPMIPEGIDLASLYQLAAALRDQGAA